MADFLADLEQVAVEQVIGDKNFYPNGGVYAVFREGEICYIGVTSSPVGRRLRQHKWDRTLLGDEFSNDLHPSLTSTPICPNSRVFIKSLTFLLVKYQETPKRSQTRIGPGSRLSQA